MFSFRLEISVNVWLNFGRKGGKEADCFVDEPCLEQSVSRPNGCLELSHWCFGSGDWYVRQKPLVECHFVMLSV